MAEISFLGKREVSVISVLQLEKKIGTFFQTNETNLEKQLSITWNSSGKLLHIKKGKLLTEEAVFI